MLVLKVIGGLCWLAAYRQAIATTKTKKRSLLPPTAIAFNLAWEGIYSAGGLAAWKRLTVEDRVQTVINVVWLINDLEWAQLQRAVGSRISRQSLVVAVLYQLTFLSRYPAGEAARISALWQNLAFSAYCSVLESVDQTDQRAIRFTAFRAVGTAIPTLTSGVLRGVRLRYVVPGICCVAFDIHRLWRQHKAADS